MKDENGKELGTFRTPSVTIEADDFTAEHVTFENTAGDVGQALELQLFAHVLEERLRLVAPRRAHLAVGIGDSRQGEGERGQVVCCVWIVFLEQIQHSTGALGNRFAQRLHVAIFQVQDAIRDIENTIVVRYEDDR